MNNLQETIYKCTYSALRKKTTCFYYFLSDSQYKKTHLDRGHRGRDRMCLSPLKLWVQILWAHVLDTTLCDKVGQWLVAGQWFSLNTPVSSSNKTDDHNISEILLKVALNTITPNS